MASEDDQQEIEQAFIASWDGVERVHKLLKDDHPNQGYYVRMLALIAELRRRGYDRRFRAGLQLSRFILSRSLQHGLRNGQPRLYIDLYETDGMTVLYYKAPNERVEFEVERVEITPEVDELFQRLLAHPID